MELHKKQKIYDAEECIIAVLQKLIPINEK